MAASPSELKLPTAVAAAYPERLTPQTLDSSNGEKLSVDVIGDNDFDSDDEDGGDAVANNDADASSLVAVSIGRAQLDMQSPTTPAATKAQVLDASMSYFEAEPDSGAQISEEPLEQESSPTRPAFSPRQQSQRAARPENQIQSMPAPWRASVAKEKPEKRSSLVSSMLSAAGSYMRPRASSGSSIVEGIKKRLPEMPSMNLPKLTGPSDTGRSTLGPASPGYLQATNKEGKMPADNLAGAMASETAHRESRSDSQEGARGRILAQKPETLRRSTSDQSLYLRRAATGASEFDDWNKFNDVSEMVNSRMKAISDTWQDSSFRMPKFPSMNHRESLKLRQRTNSDETRSNTRMNTGSLQPTNMHRPRQRLTSAADGSVSKHPILKGALLRTKGDLVILGGYRGSILREAQYPHRQLWVPIKVGMNLRKADLEVGLTREDELNMEEKIIADGTLSHIGPVDICRRLIRKCKKCVNVQEGKLRVHDYGYDWRLSPDLLAEKLIRYLERLPCNRTNLPAEKRGAWIIAHSLGGLITRYAVNKRPELFAGVVYAGTPQNCVNVLGPLRHGDDVLFSSRVLTAQVNFTLRTSYALLPESGRCFINKQTGERYDVNFFDVKTWEENRLSPCIRPALRRNKPEKRTSIIGSISEAMSQSMSQNSKRSSWLSSWNNETSSSQQTDHSSPVRDTMEEVKEDVADAAEAAKPDAPLSPTLAGSSSQSARSKPSIATQNTIPLPAATAYLTNTLASVLEFKQNLSHLPELQDKNAYPPAGILFSKNTPTVFGAFVTSREAIKYDDAFDDLAFAAGDGVVLASAAQLPNGYRCVRGGRVESERGHVGLLGDLEGVGKCLSAVIDARSRGVGLGAYDR